MRQQLKKAVGGPLYLELRRPPDEGSITITITRHSGEALAVPVSGDAVEDPFRFEGDINGAEGQDYIVFESEELLPVGAVLTLVNGAGQSQLLQVRDCKSVGGDIEVYFRSPLDFSVSSGSVVCHKVRHVVVAENCPLVEQLFHVVVEYEVSGEVYGEEFTYDVGLVRNYNPASYAEFSAAWPSIDSDNTSNWLRTGLDSALAAGYDSVESVYAAAGKNVNRIRNRVSLVPQIINRTMYWMAVAGIVPSAWTEKVEEWLAFLDDQFDNLYQTANIAWYDDDDDGEASDEELLADRVTSIRLVK